MTRVRGMAVVLFLTPFGSARARPGDDVVEDSCVARSVRGALEDAAKSLLEQTEALEREGRLEEARETAAALEAVVSALRQLAEGSEGGPPETTMPPAEPPEGRRVNLARIGGSGSGPLRFLGHPRAAGVPADRLDPPPAARDGIAAQLGPFLKRLHEFTAARASSPSRWRCSKPVTRSSRASPPAWPRHSAHSRGTSSSVSPRDAVLDPGH